MGGGDGGGPVSEDGGVLRVGRVPGFDSIRGIAVLIILVTHVWAVFPVEPISFEMTEGGFLAVDMFFVLSGFLITALLVQEHRERGRISFRNFYMRRGIRLLPALFFFLALYTLYSVAEDYPPFGRADFTFDSIEAIAFYYMNWRVLWNPLGAADLTAIWTLSIEEQFYFVWPVTLVGILAFTARRGVKPVWIVGMAALATSVWRSYVFHRWGWEAAYLRTEARFDALLWGAFTALLFLGGHLPRQMPKWTPIPVVAIWVATYMTMRADERISYLGGILLWTLACLTLIVYFANHPDRFATGRVARFTAAAGTVSYALYLYQLPSLRAVERWTPGWPVAPRIGAALALIVGLTLVSWFLIERPMLSLKRRLRRTDKLLSPVPDVAGSAPPASG
jgi:peptidoglycan/LPS O-acetylase OafA/YrhL